MIINHVETQRGGGNEHEWHWKVTAYRVIITTPDKSTEMWGSSLEFNAHRCGMSRVEATNFIIIIIMDSAEDNGDKTTSE